MDAQHGLRHDESVAQAAAADRLVVTKSDLADPAPVTARLRRLNPAAPIVLVGIHVQELEVVESGVELRHAPLALHSPEGATVNSQGR